ncbi:MAG: beta-ketoacyl-[acyl-carrier-protein] synthase family protein [Verrucomicrobia bacterium]|nr:beta-ketoacyl-[acyl-carrier-protein] synthase family protein [Verrucomicrobiota bacterium]
MPARAELPPDRRAVITGIGPVTAAGIGKDALWSGLLSERSPVSRVTRFDVAQSKAKCAAEISGFDAGQWFAPHETKRWDRCTQFAMVAAQLAISDSGLELKSGELHPRSAVSFGTALGGIADAEAQHAKFIAEGARAISRSLALQIYGGATHSNISIHWGLQGSATTHSNSCASGNVALGDAWRLIREGAADVVIAGAAESPLTPLTFAAFDQIHTMSRWQGEPASRACRPFDAARDGFVMGEGAACFVIESLKHASQRGARIYAEIAGFSLVSEAHHMTIPRPDGEPLRRAMQNALAAAQLNPSDVDYINAHASSTPQNDFNEAAQIAAVFGNNAPPVSGTKAFTGHALGAAGAMECAICLLAIEHGWTPPTLNFEKSECAPLDFVPNHGRETPIKTVLSNSFGFGGVDSCLVLKKA